jgi:hypothetical protein
MQIDRSETAQALAKAIAFKQCGKDREAAEWAAKLVRLLRCHEILREHERTRPPLHGKAMGP